MVPEIRIEDYLANAASPNPTEDVWLARLVVDYGVRTVPRDPDPVVAEPEMRHPVALSPSQITALRSALTAAAAEGGGDLVDADAMVEILLRLARAGLLPEK